MLKPLFSFGIMADCQYANVPDNDEDGDRRFRSSLGKLQEAVDFFNQNELKFVVHLGDLIDQKLESFAKPLAICAKSKTRVWQLAGNHDFCSKNYVKGQNRAEVLKNLGLELGYYSKQLGGWRFIAIDGNDQGVIEWKEGTKEWYEGQALIDKLASEGRINARSWNGAVGNTQMEWLISELQAAEKADQNIIMFSHQALFPKHQENLLNDEELLPELIKFKNLRAFINGHNHAGNYGQYQHLHCLTMHGMVETAENAYALAHIYSDHIEIEGHGRMPSRTLNFMPSGVV